MRCAGGRFYPDICSGARAPYWPHPFPLHSTRLKYHTHGLGGLIMTSLYDKEILRKRTWSQLDCCDPANSKLVDVLLLLRFLMLRNVLTTFCRLKVGQEIKAEVKFGHVSGTKFLFRPWAQDLVKILKLKLDQSFDADVWLRLDWSWCLVEILKLKVDHDLYKNLWYDFDMNTQPFGPLCL